MKGALVVLGMFAGWPLTLLAQGQADPVAKPAQAESQLWSGERAARWGLNANLGAGGAKGEFSSLLQTPISGEINLFRAHGPWRFGVGISFGSFSMREPYVNGLEWGLQ